MMKLDLVKQTRDGETHNLISFGELTEFKIMERYRQEQAEKQLIQRDLDKARENLNIERERCGKICDKYILKYKHVNDTTSIIDILKNIYNEIRNG